MSRSNSFYSKVIVQTHRRTRAGALPGPLNWSVMMSNCNYRHSYSKRMRPRRLTRYGTHPAITRPFIRKLMGPGRVLCNVASRCLSGCPGLIAYVGVMQYRINLFTLCSAWILRSQPGLVLLGPAYISSRPSSIASSPLETEQRRPRGLRPKIERIDLET